MQQQGTSTIVVYEREGDIVTPCIVQRSWYRGSFAETARWRVPFAQLRREPMFNVPAGPLGYGRAELVAGGFIKPSLHWIEGLPYLSFTP